MHFVIRDIGMVTKTNSDFVRELKINAYRFCLQITIISCGKSYSINAFESRGSIAWKRVIKYAGMRPFS
jgi:hypothetical protein